ncbi:MAG: DUF4136 domain-containing protein [Sphingobacteriia bacterium]|nr:DUF4136 domain-containing protein [Sphingobacteriia bacterium]
MRAYSRHSYTVIFITTAVILLASGCSSRLYRDIQSSYDKSADFTRYKTFAWIPGKDSADDKTVFGVMRNNTINYFTHCMGERGYIANVDNPDLLLELVIKSETKEKKDPSLPAPYSTTTVTTYGNPFLHPLSNPFKYNKPFTYKYFNYTQADQLPKETYLKNSIRLNIIDRMTQKVVWTGIAAADLYDSAYLNMNLHPVVYDILEQYPVKAYHNHRNKTKQ